LPGRYLRILPAWPESHRGGDAGRVEERTYWQIDFPDRGEEERELPRRDSRAKERLVDEYEHLLEKAVERRLRADVPVVSYLSGGVDSSLVAALACAQRRRAGDGPIPTYTVAIDEPGLNEAREAAQVAQHLGSRQTVVSCGRQEVIDSYPQLIRAAEAPVIDTSCAALLMLARRVHDDGYKVAMTGEGADEWLAGYPWFKAHRLLGCLDVVPGVKLSQYARRLYLRATGAPRFSWDRVREVEAIVGGPNAWLNLYGLFGAMKLRFFSAGMWEQLAGRIPYADLQLDVERSRKWHPFNRSVHFGARVMLPGLLLAAKGDRVAMNSSVETRYPYLDEDVFAFLARLHPAWKMSGLRDKLILRRVAERWLPARTAWRRKAMFRAPFDAFRAHNPPPFIGQLLSREALHKTGYFDAPAVTHWQNASRAMRPGSVQRTMTEMALAGVLATQLWHHLFIEGTAADPAV
jgi:asparagine synthase (glutamine-hydrolysing)